MSLLIQISDPHFGTEQLPVVEALTRLVHEQKPELVILSGDLTQRARRAQFRSAKKFIDGLGVPSFMAIPGNHDISLFNPASRLFRPYAKFHQEFGHNLEPMYESDRLLVITLKSTGRLRHANGKVSKAQIEGVAKRLENASAAQLCIVVVHHPVYVTRPEDKENLLHGHATAVGRWVAAGADLIMGGHIHLPFVYPLHEGFPKLERRAWAVQAGTALSSRLRFGAANSVNLIRYGESSSFRHCTVERWDYVVAAKTFSSVDTIDLPCDAPHN